MFRLLLLGFSIVGTALVFAPGAAAGSTSGNDGLAALHFRFLGPIGNRDIAVAGVPGNPKVAYFGAASGGIWKTEDGGIHFVPIFDSADVSSVGALALAPSDPNTVWAGTGEPYIIREATSPGNGVYKSTDAGKTWQHMGLDQTGHIAHIAINPTNPNIVFVCAIGQAYKPNSERGVFRTEDGGATWKQVLKINDTTGCSGLSMDVHDPNTVFASTWQVQIRPWDLNSGGTDGGVFVTHDGGNTWVRLSGHGLPPAGTLIGKSMVRVAPSNGQIVYVLMQTAKTGQLYRSHDGGQDWTLVHESDALDMRAPYYTNFTVAPNNPDILYIPSTPMLVSHDGGKTITEQGGRGKTAKRPTPGVLTYTGGDTHDVWIDPKNPDRILTADDEGGEQTLNGGETWSSIELPIAQIYHIDTDTSIPYNVVGNRQDTGGQIGPSRVLFGGFGGGAGIIPAGAWHGFAGCESGFARFDQVDPNIVWSGCYNGDLVRVNLKTGQSRNVSIWPIATFGAPTNEVRDRWNWSFPIAISPSDHNRVYTGSQFVYETTNQGQSWKRISPDLTTGQHLGNSGGLTKDNLMTFSSATLSIIDESPIKAGVIWTGSYDGQVNVTRDGGAHWTNVTANIKGLPPFGTIDLQASPFDAGTAYVSSDLKEMGDYNPYIFKTTDYGKTWNNISGDIPHSEFSFVHVVISDPVRKGMLYAGTENGLYISWDDGSHWTRLRNNFPPAPVYGLKVQQHFNDLVIATYGRGIWVLDDVTPLRTWDEVSKAGQPHLFAPRNAYRFRTTVTQVQEYKNGITEGENIPYGADLDYYLPSAAPVQITITNSAGQVIRVMDEKGTAGLNRVFWNLRYKNLLQAKLLTDPPGEPWVHTPAAGRPLSVWGAPRPDYGPLAVPGTFTVKLSADGANVGTQSLEVLPDPHSLGTQAQMEAGRDLLLKIAGAIDQTVTLINKFEVTRQHLESLSTQSSPAAVRTAAAALATKAIAIEGRLFDIKNAGSSEFSFQRTPQLYAKLGSLYDNLDNAGADLGPTDPEQEANAELQKTLASVQREAAAFYANDVASFNSLLRKHDITEVPQP